MNNLELLLSKFKYPLLFSGVLLFIFTITRNVLGLQLAYSDFTPFNNSFNQTFLSVFYVWNTNFTGLFETKGLFYMLRGLIEFISFNNAIVAQDIFIISVLVCAYFSMFYFLNRCKLPFYISTIFSFFYVCNPVTSNEFSNGINDIFILYALIPIFVISCVDLLEKYSFKKGFLLSIVVALCLMNIQTAFWNFLILIPLIILFCFLNKALPIKNIAYIALHFFIGLLLNILSLFPLFNVVGGYSDMSYFETFRHTYRLSQFDNIFRLVGNNGSSQPLLGYYDLSTINILSFAFFIIICIYFYFKKYKKEDIHHEKVITLTSTIILMIYSLLMYFIGLGIFDTQIVDKNLLLVSLRNPQKLYYLYSFSFIVLLAYSSTLIIKYLSTKNTVIASAFLIFVAVLWAFQNIHFLRGDFDQNIIRSTNYFIQNKFKDLTPILQKIDPDTKILVLPFDYTTQQQLTWVSNLVKYRMGGSMYSNAGGSDMLSDIYDNICTSNQPFLATDDVLNISYIVLDKHPQSYLQKDNDNDCGRVSYYDTPYIWGKYDFFRNRFAGLPIYYENENFVIFKRSNGIIKNIFTLDEQLVSLNEREKNNDSVNFIKNGLNLNKVFFYELNSKNELPPSIYVADPFSKLMLENIVESDTLEKSIELPNQLRNGKIYLYSTQNKNDTYVTLQDSELIFYRYTNNNNLEVNNFQIFDKATSTKIILNKKLIKDFENTYIKSSHGYHQIKSGEILNLGIVANKINVVNTKNNIIQNYSFEDGLWQDIVSDCRNIEGEAQIQMEPNFIEKTEGGKSLELKSINHVACVFTRVSITESGAYLFSLDYQSPNTNKASYHIGFDGHNFSSINESLSHERNKWDSLSRIINVVAGTKYADIYLYSEPANKQDWTINRYDNIRFEKISTIEDIEIPTYLTYNTQEINLPYGTSTFVYKTKAFNFNNLVPNGSFNEGEWKEVVDDCGGSGNDAEIGMQIVISKDIKYNKILQLESLKHTACTSQTITVNGDATYLFSFDYLSPNSKTASYYLGFNDFKHSSISEKINITTNEKWNSYERVITTPKDATSLTLYFYAQPVDGRKKIVNQYDNVKLIQIPKLDGAFNVVSNSKAQIFNLGSTTFQKINPTKKLIQITGASTPFYLAMSDSYHPLWQAELNNMKSNGIFTSWIPWVHPDKIQDDYHFKLNGFLNGWYVDPVELCGEKGSLKEGCTMNEDGSYNIELIIEFTPQRWFYVGLIISGTTLLGCFIYLGYDFVRRRRRNIS